LHDAARKLDNYITESEALLRDAGDNVVTAAQNSPEVSAGKNTSKLLN
jgi:hypothetical protein